MAVYIIQYADDISIYSISANLETCKDMLDEAVNAISRYLMDLGLSISADKSSVVPFSRRRHIPFGNQIQLGGMTFSCVNKVTFLGMELTAKLNWNAHVAKIGERANLHLNVLRAFTNISWGADPTMALLYYRATIRSIFDYGSFLYGVAAPTVISKLDKIQYRALRLATGLLQSTPINVLLAESGEPPLQLRRELLAKRTLASLYSRNNRIFSTIAQLSINDLTKQFWEKKPSPLLCAAFSLISPDLEWIKQSEVPFRYSIEYDLFHEPLKVTSLPPAAYLTHASAGNFLSDLLNKKYPDGSINNDKVGCAFIDIKAKVSRQYRLCDKASIYSAEAYAIKEALAYATISGSNHSSIVIISDSQSVLSKLKLMNPSKKISFLESKIANLVSHLKAINTPVRFLWIRGHTGNSTVDTLAKEATSIPQRVLCEFPATDLNRRFRTEMMTKWQHRHNSYPSGVNYQRTFPQPGVRSWISKLPHRPKHFFRIISRLRSGHNITKAYLTRIGRADSELCNRCSVLEDAEHIIMLCPAYNPQRTVLFEKIAETIQRPFNLELMLVSEDIQVYDAIVQFVKDSGIHI